MSWSSQSGTALARCELEAAGVDFTVHVVGFALESATESAWTALPRGRPAGAISRPATPSN